MSFLSKIFGKASFPPPKRTNKTLEERKSELLSQNRYNGDEKTTKRSPFVKLFIPMLVLVTFFYVFSTFSNPSTDTQKYLELSPLYPDYSQLTDITANTDIIFRGLVIDRGTAKRITVKDEKKTTKKTLFTPILLNVITPIKGEFSSNEASYLELGGETMSEIIEVAGVTPLAVDDEVFLFCLNNKTGFGKWSVIYVEGGYVTIESNRLPSSHSTDEKYTKLKAEDFALLINELI